MSYSGISQQAFYDLFSVFAEFFTFPDQEFCESVRSGQVDQQISELSQKVGYPIASELKKDAPTYEEWVALYNHCFLGARKPFAPPIESIYKQWTLDGSYQVPFKHQKGYLMGDSAQHVRHLLQAFELELPIEYNMMPDHLSILLELLAFLVGNGFVKEAQQFCQDHLDWLPDLYKALADLPVDSSIYLAVLNELEKALQIFACSTIDNTQTIEYSCVTAASELN
ncbi:putative component of anaerobic dehydrogenase [Desulfitobacterium dichloroeliminans LMG P-21439]|uniref:Putative component of anaerobic dehydrogenase n=1 Tax=Desulfitobacterium dichloroeliminans (strain LMG P-21439 / DCA1) TaxID=871963 RepID=L0F6E9_DESDL|nr:molecular chaperone TorD family protein [Desulfitobacterium dichloroeliminans]AGA68767.1 putative component of anaerobic dehydrogenase [Desulfitobacterium dichloroeliminans LMG P-21439]